MSLTTATRKKKAIVKTSVATQLPPESVDNLIKLGIAQLTAENSSVWTSPDHNRREFAHCFFQYPAMMVPIVQKRVIDLIKQAKPDTRKILDPFMGSGTSLVASMTNGLDCYGQDINPLAILIAKVRTGPYYVKAITEKQKALYISIKNDKSEKIEANFKGLNKWFKPRVITELSKIVRAIRKEPSLVVRRFYWVNLAETIRLTSNDRTSTYKLHARSLEEIETRNTSPFAEFNKHLTKSIKDLELHCQLLQKHKQLKKGRYKGHLCFKLLDSSSDIYTPRGRADYFDLLVTSPPYGDNKTTVTYGQHSYLPLQWINFEDIADKIDAGVLKSTLEIDSRALGGKVQKLDEQDILNLYLKSESFKKVHLRLKTEKSRELANKVLYFIKDLSNVIKQIFLVMKPDSYQVWTIGNRTVGGIEIPNNKILQELIQSQNGLLVEKIEREIINKRMAKRNSQSDLMTTEDILIFRKLG